MWASRMQNIALFFRQCNIQSCSVFCIIKSYPTAAMRCQLQSSGDSTETEITDVAIF
jgi:hypothetical protein